MSFKPGHKKFGGRTIGTPNKSTQTLMQKCEELGLDVFGTMVTLAMETDAPFEKFRMLTEIAGYLYPKRKALEVEATVNMELAKKAEEYAAMTKEEQVILMEEELERLKGE